MKPREPLARPQRVRLSTQAMERRLLVGVGSTALVLLVAVFAFIELSSVRASKRWVEHTLEVIASLHEVQTTLLDAETGQRGFLVTSEPTYLGPYTSAMARVKTTLLRLRALTADNAEQQRRLDALERDIDDRFAALGAVLQLNQAGDREGAVALVRTGPGQRDMESARRGFAEMFAVEESLLLAREATHERDIRITTAIIGGGSALAFCLSLAVSLGIRSGVLDGQADQKLLDAQNRVIASQTDVLVENEHTLALRFQELGAVKDELDAQIRRLLHTQAEAERAFAELGKTSHALEKANRDLDHFAFAASHELRAPLRGIGSLSDWLEEESRAGADARFEGSPPAPPPPRPPDGGSSSRGSSPTPAPRAPRKSPRRSSSRHSCARPSGSSRRRRAWSRSTSPMRCRSSCWKSRHFNKCGCTSSAMR